MRRRQDMVSGIAESSSRLPLKRAFFSYQLESVNERGIELHLSVLIEAALTTRDI